MNHNLQSNIFYKKYIKYKKKYLDLKNSEFFGGNLNSAKKYFNKFLQQEKNKKKFELIVKDLNEKLNIDTQDPDEIFLKIVEGINDNIAHDFVRIYLMQQMGIPNSIENKGRFIDASNKLKILRNNKNIVKTKIPGSFMSLSLLEKFIDNNKKNLDKIKIRDKDKKKKHVKHRKIEEEGKDYVNTILNNENVIIYQPTTVAGSICYGRETKWCTAATNNNAFSYYNEKGLLYIIKSKKLRRKFQLHIETESLTDEKDETIEIETVIQILNNDSEFKNWFNNLILEYYKKKIIDKKLILSIKWLPTFTKEYNKLIDILIFDDLLEVNQPLNNKLDNLTNLQKLIFGDRFNQPLNNSLDKLTNLQILVFNKNSVFNQPLNNSLNNLTNLLELTFGRGFNQPLNDSLNNLTNLLELTFGWFFNQHLNDSLNNLTNLLELTFDSHFNQPFGNSLNNITNLQQLTLGHRFNQPLDNSLDKLTNLLQLTFNDFNNFNQPLDNSLNNLTNLLELTFGMRFNKYLGNSLNNLTNLRKLTFGMMFNKPLGNSLNNLTNLRKLNIKNDDYNLPLNDKLSKIIVYQ